MSLYTKLTPPSVKCQPAVAPNLVQFDTVLAEGEGATPTVVNTVAAGGVANATNVQFMNESCFDMQVSVTYLTGGGCAQDGCVDAADLVPQVVVFEVGPWAVIEIPGGAWSNMEFVVVDDAGAPLAIPATKSADVRVYGACEGICPECAVVVPA